jgi:hypothetical protein
MMDVSEQVETKSVLPLGAIASYLAFLLFLVLLQSFWKDALSSRDIGLLNLLVPILFGAANLLLAWKLARTSPLAVWNPLFWLLLASTLYYGLGQLVHILGNPDTIQRVNKTYFVDQAGLARTNLLNTVGVMTIVGAYLATALMTKLRSVGVNADADAEAQDRRGISEAKWAAILFLLIGLPVKYFLQLPYDLGLLTWVLPGSIKYLGTLSGVAIIPLYWLHKKRGGIYRPLFLSLIISESLVSLVTLSKLEMIKTALFVLLGSQLVKPGFKRLLAGGVVLALAYVLVLNPFVTFARVAIKRAAASDLSQVMDLVEQYKKQSSAVQDFEFPQAQLWWARLAYSNVELFAIRQYDRGQSGTTFQLAPYTLIPRFIMPEKPWMNSGLEFTYLITGDRTMLSATGLGAIGEGYWNGGWLGVAIVGVVIGVLMAGLTVFSIRAVTARAFMFLPISLAGIMLGLRIDDWFVPTYIGTSLQLLLVYCVFRFVIYPIFSGYSDASRADAVQDAIHGRITRSEESNRRYALVEKV